MTKRNIRIWLFIMALIATDQTIKIIINRFFLDVKAAILSPVLYFEPIFNRHYSWVNSMLRLDLGKWFHAAVTAVVCAVIILFFLYLRKKEMTGGIVSVGFAFLIAGSLCSLIDKVLWDGSLDYILLGNLFTFDLKDVFINVFTGLLIFSLIFKSKVFEIPDEKDFLKGFMNFILRKT